MKDNPDKRNNYGDSLPLQRKEDLIYIVWPRKAFGLTDFNFFDENFLTQCPCYMTIGCYKEAAYSKEFAEDDANRFVLCLADSLNDVANPFSGIIKEAGILKYEAYAKFGYAPDRYDQFLDFVKSLKNNRVIIDSDDREKALIYLSCLRKEHVIDLSLVNKKKAVTYLYNNGHKFTEDVPDLTRKEYNEIISGYNNA